MPIYFLLLLLLLPLSSHSSSDFTTLTRFAELAAISYMPPAVIESKLNKKGVKLKQQEVIKGVEIHYFIVTDEKRGVETIVIRGTSNLENALTNIDFKLITDAKSGLKLHSGFTHAAQAIYRQITTHLNKKRPIYITGHSLGGAVAQIIAIYLQQDGYQLKEVITFGQPKVSNFSAAQSYPNLPLIRVVTPRDVIPLIPPFDIVEINKPDIYWHMGEAIILAGRGQYSRLNGLRAMLRATNIVGEPFGEENLQHHLIDHYLQELRQLEQRAEEVSFEHRLNLDGLWGLFSSQ